jgi:hypothetical protein
MMMAVSPKSVDVIVDKDLDFSRRFAGQTVILQFGEPRCAKRDHHPSAVYCAMRDHDASIETSLINAR